jgi:outer membrane protein OmpA-like peptidoglycan-associated protein
LAENAIRRALHAFDAGRRANEIDNAIYQGQENLRQAALDIRQVTGGARRSSALSAIGHAITRLQFARDQLHGRSIVPGARSLMSPADSLRGALDWIGHAHRAIGLSAVSRPLSDRAESYTDDGDLGLYNEHEPEAFDPRPPAPGTIVLPRFAFASASLTAPRRAAIARLAADILRRMPGVHAAHCFLIEVEGHEDEVGDPARFRQMGLARALAVARRLQAVLEAGIRKLPAMSQRHVHISVRTAGPTRPIRSNVTAEGRAVNRRVEIRSRVDLCPGAA